MPLIEIKNVTKHYTSGDVVEALRLHLVTHNPGIGRYSDRIINLEDD